MEGGSPILEWITYGMIACVLGALAFLAFRSAWFFASLFAIPLTSLLARTRFRRRVRQWGERGIPAGGVPTLGASDEEALDEALATQSQVPAAVRRALIAGAILGAVPGLWWAVRGVRVGLARGDALSDLAATVGIALGLVGAAGIIAGAVVGVAVGLVFEALRPDPAVR